MLLLILLYETDKNKKKKHTFVGQLNCTLLKRNAKSLDDHLALRFKWEQLNCVLTWRTFNDLYYPEDWNYGENVYAVNPITFNMLNNNWSDRKAHYGVLMPNQKIFFKKNISARSHLGMVWIKIKSTSFLNKYSRNDYHMADYNLFWLNIRENLKYRLSLLNQL